MPNLLAVLIATVFQFIVGAIWYSVFFGKMWGEIHGFNKLSKDVQQKMMKEMGPYYAVQFLITLVATYILAIFITNLPGWNPYAMAGFFWLGFIVPTQISAAIFGGTPREWLVKKVLVQAASSFLCLEVGTLVLHLMR